MINKNFFKPRLLCVSLAIAFSSAVIAESEPAAPAEMEKPVITLDNVVSGLSAAFDKLIVEAAKAVEKSQSAAPVEAVKVKDKVEKTNTTAAVTKPKSCEPVLHGDFFINTETVTLKNEKGEYRIDSAGNLASGTQALTLTSEQLASLNTYQKTIREDLIFLNQYLKTEITNTWKVFDTLFAKELGEKSKLRAELQLFHDNLQQSISKAYSVENDVVKFDHKAIMAAVAEFEKGIPVLISNVSIRGFSDIAELSASQNNKILFVAQKVKSLQENFMADMKTQRQHVRTVRANMCSKFANWQEQEGTLRKQIPALESWKSVSFKTAATTAK